jgi:hypothetical protein
LDSDDDVVNLDSDDDVVIVDGYQQAVQHRSVHVQPEVGEGVTKREEYSS